MFRKSMIIASMLAATLCKDGFGASVYYYVEPEYGIFNAIVIDGKIESGDYAKFLSAVLEAGSDPGQVFISSPGGSVVEAMRIGRLIRKLRFKTQIPEYFGSRIGTRCPTYDVRQCICASACVLIYLAGIDRWGDSIEIHRSFIDHDLLKELSLERAGQLARSLAIQTSKYLEDMGAPESLSERMAIVSSDELVRLERSYIQKYILGVPNEFEEWLFAHCGNSLDLVEKMRQNMRKAAYDELEMQLHESHRCERRLFSTERNRAFTPTISDALQTLGNASLPVDLAIHTAISRDFDVTHLVGKPVTETAPHFTLLGFGKIEAEKIANWQEADASLSIGSNFHMILDGGAIHSIDLAFWESEDQYPYAGFFLFGLDSGSTIEDFKRKLGSPAGHAVGRGSTANLFLFQTERADFIAYINKDLGTIRALRIHVKNYLEDSAFKEFLEN